MKSRKVNSERSQIFLKNLTILIDELMNSYAILPKEITTSRLVCLNKDASKPGDKDNIRGIAVNGIIFKIMEAIALDILKNDIKSKNLINKEQIGFMEGLGCEVNLMRLRQRAFEVKESNKNDSKFIVFIDLKGAYDAVPHYSEN